MSEKQFMLDGTLVPTRKHYDDQVECSDGMIVSHGEAFYDCKDHPHNTEEDRNAADVAIVTEFLDGVDGWVTDYTTGNTDYADGYAHIIDEISHDWKDRVDEWIDEDDSDYADIIEDAYNAGELDFDFSSDDGDEFDSDEYIRNVLCKPSADSVKEWVFERLEGSFDCEPEFSHNEYSCYSGSGCCLASFEIGEYEEQLSIADHPVLKELHDCGRLDDILDDVSSDAYVSRSHRREKNKETGYYENVGRETYDPYGSDYPDVMTYHNPGGQWHWVVSGERMEELIREAIVDLTDGND